MTLPRPTLVAAVLSTALGLTGLSILGGPATSAPAGPRTSPATAPVAVGESRTWDRTYYSAPPTLTEKPARAERRARPKPAPTKGVVTGRAVGPAGTPIRGALVYGVRYSDLGLPVDFSEEKRVVTRTGRDGTFRLKQLKERYLIRICAAEEGAVECSTDTAVKYFAPTYVGPEGTTVTWLRHTSMFAPRRPVRALGRITVKASAVLAGTVRNGPHQAVYLTRGNGSIAETAFTDEDGEFRFEVAGGTYRLEAERDPGLRSESTVPGYRSKKLKLKPNRVRKLVIRTRHAGVVRGTVRSGGNPVADVFLAVLDKNGRFAAGVVTGPDGGYQVTSLEPGDYTIRTSAGFSDYVPTSKAVTLDLVNPRVVDFALEPGATVRFSSAGAVSAELRQAGRVVKVYQGLPAAEPGGQVRFRGLPPGSYRLYVRKAAFPYAAPTETNFPWDFRQVDIVDGLDDYNLNAIDLVRPTLSLTGSMDKGSQVKVTALPQDPWLRESYTQGDQVTPMALLWTAKATAAGTYTVHGMVPGSYTALQTTAYRDRGNKPTGNGANIATTVHSVTVSDSAPRARFRAPKGAKLKGRMRYLNGNSPIAPIGFRVHDEGDTSWVFPTVSEKQRFGQGFRVERLHRGAAYGRLLDLQGLYEEHPGTLVPDSLVASARTAEPGTPFYLTTKLQRFTLKKGKKALDLGVLRLVVKSMSGGI